MATLSVYDGYAGTFVSGVQSSNFSGGIRWQASQDGWVTALCWVNPSGTTVPVALRLWDTVQQAPVASITTVPAGVGTGWQVLALPFPVFVFANREYRVDAERGASTNNARVIGGTTSITAPTPLSMVSAGGGGGVVGTGSAYPNLGIQDIAYGADVIWTDTNPGTGAPPTDSTVENSFAGWLSSGGDNTHHTDLPWRTDNNVTTIKSEAEGATGFDAIKGVVDTITTSVGAGIGTAVSALTTAVGTANTALVHAATTWSDALAAALQAMSDNFASFGASKPAQGGGDFGAGTFPSNVGTLVWTMLDETDFVECIAWAQPADVYVLSITARPIGLPLNLTCGVPTIYRCGWWTPLNGSFGRQRSYIDFEDSHLAIGAERMPGVLVSLQPGGEGHIQAWSLT